MSVTSMTYGRPHRIAHPTLNHFTAIALRAANGLLQRLDHFLEADRREPQTVQEVLAYASYIEKSDPGLASDLRGAAMRAEAD